MVARTSNVKVKMRLNIKVGQTKIGAFSGFLMAGYCYLRVFLLPRRRCSLRDLLRISDAIMFDDVADTSEIENFIRNEKST
jgi:hypothetical protein